MGPLVGAARTKGPYKRAVALTMYECFILIEINSKRVKGAEERLLTPPWWIKIMKTQPL